jgi:hypothetical protein
MGSITASWVRKVMAVTLVVCSAAIHAEDDFERSPIHYSKAEPSNCISDLQKKLDSGEVKFQYDEKYGYLPSLLEALDVERDTQMLVFSKTSLQLQKISPRTPRAIYFNDNVYVGFCQQGDVLEISAVDPKLGAVFYSLDQEAVDRPRMMRHTDNCLTCHSSSRTEGVPGHLARSVYPDARGLPLLSEGSHNVNYKTPIEKRWGGWYVTGKHGKQTHMGNVLVKGREVPDDFDFSVGSNVNDLTPYFNPDKYLEPNSDIAALMVMEHQIVVHNMLTKASFMTRQAMEYQAMMHESLGVPKDEMLDSVKSRIRSAGNDLVDAMLMVEEAHWSEPIQGNTSFTERFSSLGPHDSKGRSLRQLDLQTRLWKYPCSYLIYSESFKVLPTEMKSYVKDRFEQILSGSDKDEKYKHLSDVDRVALREILAETKVWE